MKPPENEEAAPGKVSGGLRSEDKTNVPAFRALVKQTILTALAGKVVTGSDFEERRLRAREASERKGRK